MFGRQKSAANSMTRWRGVTAMAISTGKSASIALAAIGLAMGLGAPAARADTVLPVTNLGFNEFDGTFSAPKSRFSTAAPTGWFTGAASDNNLIGVGNQGSETSSSGVYAVYPGTGFSNTVPAGTNFYQADGNPQFESTIYQYISGITPGTYSLQFQQAAGQQDSGQFNQPTTEQWKVFLGVGGIGTDCTGGSNCTVTGTTNNVEQDSTLMHTDAMSNFDWNNVNLSFTVTADDFIQTGPHAGDIVLTFLAWGNDGSTANQPPTVFLEGVNTTPIPNPEPATLSLLGVGAVGIVGAIRRRRGKSRVAG
jgi:hypothetical protein